MWHGGVACPYSTGSWAQVSKDALIHIMVCEAPSLRGSACLGLVLGGRRRRRCGAARHAALRLLLRLRSSDRVCVSRKLSTLVVLLLLLRTLVASRDCAAEEMRVQAV